MSNHTGKLRWEEGIQIWGFKNSAYKDYLAARQLLNSNLLPQAAVFMATALEKELKTLLSLSKMPFKRVHDPIGLYKELILNKPNLKGKLNSEFLEVLSDIYKSRYWNDKGVKPGYNFTIVKNKFLAEMDFTYLMLESRSKLSRTNVEIQKTKLELDTENKLSILFDNNHVLNKINKADFLKNDDYVYEFRVLANNSPLEQEYPAVPDNNLSKFRYIGLNPDATGASFNSSHVLLNYSDQVHWVESDTGLLIFPNSIQK